MVEQTVSVTERKLCDNGHTWRLERTYRGSETWRLTETATLTDLTTGAEREVPIAELRPDDVPLGIEVTVTATEVKDDTYLDVEREWLGCAYCPAQIDAERVGEVDFG